VPIVSLLFWGGTLILVGQLISKNYPHPRELIWEGLILLFTVRKLKVKTQKSHTD